MFRHSIALDFLFNGYDCKDSKGPFPLGEWKASIEPGFATTPLIRSDIGMELIQAMKNHDRFTHRELLTSEIAQKFDSSYKTYLGTHLSYFGLCDSASLSVWSTAFDKYAANLTSTVQPLIDAMEKDIIQKVWASRNINLQVVALQTVGIHPDSDIQDAIEIYWVCRHFAEKLKLVLGNAFGFSDFNHAGAITQQFKTLNEQTITATPTLYRFPILSLAWLSDIGRIKEPSAGNKDNIFLSINGFRVVCIFIFANSILLELIYTILDLYSD